LRVSESLPSVTIIVAARPEQPEIEAVIAARRLEYPRELLEIIVARGKQPSVQRNAAMKVARGDWIYFLDDDSVPPPGNLRLASKFFADPAVKMAGGPNLCPPDAPLLEQVFATVLASWVPFGPSRARYASVGKVRSSGEKELILCNLLARRAAMLELGGFNEALYPNEENALMDELQKRGGKLIYDPQLIVHRRPRRSLRSFVRMLMTYGRGRAEQFRVNPTPGSALNFVPPLLCLYVVVLVLLMIVLRVVAVPTDTKTLLTMAGVAPFMLFLLAVVFQTIASIPGHGLVRSLLALPLLVVSPLLYGLGFWRGLFTRLKPPQVAPAMQVELQKINLG
jgi:cellulose synthase/poly-beta-1,6-N-acetylglucosamine synthase-like glycosyltransferase